MRPVGHGIVQAQADKAHETEAVAYLSFALGVGQRVTMLGQCHLEQDQRRMGRPPGAARIGACQQGVDAIQG